MEVGAVKQAFNNEVILLKKNLNQAKIQIINKLTRKAKTLSEKKVPENVKAKFNRQAESAVKEVLIIKRIKPKDIAKFIVTHKGQLNQYLYRPTVDEEKACARLLLHKALQDKYKLIRERFSNISIDDLFMSRQERRKRKKEAREKQKDKKKGKGNTPVQVKGDGDVEDINMDDSIKNNASDDQVDDKSDDESDSESDNEQSDDENDSNNDDRVNDDRDLKTNNENLIETVKKTTVDSTESSELNNDEKSDDESNEEVDGQKRSFGTFVKPTPSLLNNDKIGNGENSKNDKEDKRDNISVKKNVEKKQKDSHKNRNLNTKILMKKFNKDTSELPTQETKVVDPFFITASGENYMSVAEPRQPDEVKEVHKEGNRKYRRAVMFGHVPKAKPRNNLRSEGYNTKFDNNKTNRNVNSDDKRRNDFDKHGQKRFKSDDSKNTANFNKPNVSTSNVDEAKPEKLHPSWEAKKRQSGILPFEGKKIVFDES